MRIFHYCTLMIHARIRFRETEPISSECQLCFRWAPSTVGHLSGHSRCAKTMIQEDPSCWHSRGICSSGMAKIAPVGTFVVGFGGEAYVRIIGRSMRPRD